jgi:hypothetical protein
LLFGTLSDNGQSLADLFKILAHLRILHITSVQWNNEWNDLFSFGIGADQYHEEPEDVARAFFEVCHQLVRFCVLHNHHSGKLYGVRQVEKGYRR